MGKKLIIIGADFSRNGIVDYDYSSVLGITDEEFENFSLQTVAGDQYCFGETFAVTTQKLNVPIIGIRILPAASGVIPVRIASFTQETGAPCTSVRLVENITVLPGDVGIVKDYIFNTPVNLSSGEKIVFGFNGLTATWKYQNSGAGYTLTTGGENGSWISSADKFIGIDYLTPNT